MARTLTSRLNWRKLVLGWVEVFHFPIEIISISLFRFRCMGFTIRHSYYRTIWAHHSDHLEQCFRVHQTLILVSTFPKHVTLLNASFPDSFMTWRHPEMTHRRTSVGRPMQGFSAEHLGPLWPALSEVEWNSHRLWGILLSSGSV